MADWKTKAIAGSTVASDIPEWRKRAIQASQISRDIFDDGPSETDIDFSEDAPALIRAQVGSLDKPDDRLAALRKTYPDARPMGDDNFIYTDETGKVRQYNQESWLPSLGDFASIGPEIGETIGGGIGSILGAVGGSMIPGPGTLAGGIGGAGLGSVAGRESAQRGLNYIFGNDDTRTGAEQARDMGITAATGMAGEGIGRAVGAGVKAGKNAWRNYAVGGEVDDVAEAAQRAADLQAIGVQPTQGMISGNQRTAMMEHALIPTRSGREIDKRITDAHSAMGNEFDRITQGMGRPLSIAEAGEALQKQAQAAKDAGFARSSDLYDDVAAKITSPAVVSNTGKFAQELATARQSYGEFDSLTKGATTDRVLETTGALLSDAQNGMSFDQLKQARTVIGQQAADTDDKVLKNHLNGLYASLTSDMEATAKASGDDALQAFRKANNQFKRLVSPETGFGPKSDASTVLTKNSDDVLNWAIGGARNGGDRIAAVRRQVQKAEGGQQAWNDVTSGVIERLGKNANDEFDPGKFRREFAKISPEAKNAMFQGTGNKQYADDLDRLSRIAENWGKYRQTANHSNTENHRAIKNSLNPLDGQNAVASLFGMNTFGTSGMLLGAAKGAAVGTVNRLSQGSRAKLLQNPDVVRIMAEMAPAKMRKGGIAAQFAKLSDLRRSTRDQALSAALADFLIEQNYEQDQ